MLDTTEVLVAIKIQLERILANQEAYIKRFEQHIIEDRLVAERVEGIQTKMNYGIGAFAAVSILWGAIGSYILAKLGFK